MFTLKRGGKKDMVLQKIKEISADRTFPPNPVIDMYADFVNFNSSENDPKSVIFETLIQFVYDYQYLFFTKKGNWKRKETGIKNLWSYRKNKALNYLIESGVVK